jgi:predicted nucleotide-binding protein
MIIPGEPRYFFVSYARQDFPRVEPILEGLRARGISLWQDTTELRPGENWTDSVAQALRGAAGMILFVSRASMSSPAVQQELATMTYMTRGLIIPVFLETVAHVPVQLMRLPHLDLSTAGTALQQGIDRLVQMIRDALARGVQTGTGISEDDIDELASSIVEEKRGARASDRKRQRPEGQPAETPSAVFIVHGHDHQVLAEVEGYLAGLGIRSIVLTKIANREQSLFQKFLTWSEDVRFAVVLLSADDWGASRKQYEAPGVAEKALRFRARQNVILELGFFYGYLGWENVFVLFKAPEQVFPDFERPSDLDGVPFDAVDAAGQWKEVLADRLRKAGFAM